MATQRPSAKRGNGPNDCPNKKGEWCDKNGNGPNSCPNEYYGIKLVPAKLLKVDVASHSFEMYFKLYIQQKLDDLQVAKLIDGFQNYQTAGASKPPPTSDVVDAQQELEDQQVRNALQSFCDSAAPAARECLGGVDKFCDSPWNQCPLCMAMKKQNLDKKKKKLQCQMCASMKQAKKKREAIVAVLNTLLSDALFRKKFFGFKDADADDDPFMQRVGGFIGKSDIIFQNNIKPIEFEKEHPSFKLNHDPLIPGSTFFAYQVHLNGRGVFSMSTQDRTGQDNTPNSSGFSWRMRQYPFDFYECCIDLNLSRHSSHSVDKMVSKILDAVSEAKPNAFFKKYNPEWLPDAGIPNFELVANEWAVWQENASQASPPAPAPSEDVYLDGEENQAMHYRVSFGTKSHRKRL
jgi:hypothetical protein